MQNASCEIATFVLSKKFFKKSKNYMQKLLTFSKDGHILLAIKAKEC